MDDNVQERDIDSIECVALKMETYILFIILIKPDFSPFIFKQKMLVLCFFSNYKCTISRSSLTLSSVLGLIVLFLGESCVRCYIWTLFLIQVSRVYKKRLTDDSGIDLLIINFNFHI